MMDQIGRDLDPVSKNDTKAMMKKHNVHQLTKTALLEVKDSSFLVKVTASLMSFHLNTVSYVSE